MCAEAKQTAGCGDNISAAGLILQVWSQKRKRKTHKRKTQLFFWPANITGLIPKKKKKNSQKNTGASAYKADQNII